MAEIELFLILDISSLDRVSLTLNFLQRDAVFFLELLGFFDGFGGFLSWLATPSLNTFVSTRRGWEVTYLMQGPKKIDSCKSLLALYASNPEVFTLFMA